MTPVWIALAGGAGALVRFSTDGLIRTFSGRNFPWGTLAINVTGSFVLGLLAGLAGHQHIPVDTKLVFGTGFCGGFTTFSTASFEAARLIEERRYAAAMFQVSSNLFLSLAAAVLGMGLG